MAGAVQPSRAAALVLLGTLVVTGILQPAYSQQTVLIRSGDPASTGGCLQQCWLGSCGGLPALDGGVVLAQQCDATAADQLWLLEANATGPLVNVASQSCLTAASGGGVAVLVCSGEASQNFTWTSSRHLQVDSLSLELTLCDDASAAECSSGLPANTAGVLMAPARSDSSQQWYTQSPPAEAPSIVPEPVYYADYGLDGGVLVTPSRGAGGSDTPPAAVAVFGIAVFLLLALLTVLGVLEARRRSRGTDEQPGNKFEQGYGRFAAGVGRTFRPRGWKRFEPEAPAAPGVELNGQRH